MGGRGSVERGSGMGIVVLRTGMGLGRGIEGL